MEQSQSRQPGKRRPTTAPAQVASNNNNSNKSSNCNIDFGFGLAAAAAATGAAFKAVFGFAS